MVSYVETWFDAEAQLGRRRKLCSRWLGKLPGSDLMSLSTIASLPSRSAKHGILCRDLVRCGSTTWETTKTMFALVGETPRFRSDVIIDDSFTSISERKAWYLMSRPGSMRKHNLGDDENYVRVGWGNSQVREQAIRIVRRWMEEDSITGRVVLGRRGGAVGAKI